MDTVAIGKGAMCHEMPGLKMLFPFLGFHRQSPIAAAIGVLLYSHRRSIIWILAKPTFVHVLQIFKVGIPVYMDELLH
jgi:hypothetical protein